MRLFRNKQELGWSLYDWANSAFATTIMAGFFPIFFKKYWSYTTDVTKSTAILAISNSLSGFLIALAAPVLGAIADCGDSKKKFLIFFAYVGVSSTAALYLVQKGYWIAASIIYVIATIGFSGSIIFYDALLPAIADKKRIDFVSALGYAMGYLGGGLLFAINVCITLKPETFGIKDSHQAIKISFLSVAIWWGIFTVPFILFVPEPKRIAEDSPKNGVRAGLQQLAQTFHKIKYLKTVFLFLAAYWFYIDGVDTTVRMAIDYGLSIGFGERDLLWTLLVTQFVSFPSAIAFGRLGEKIGPKRAIFIAIGVFLFAILWAMSMTNVYEFYGLALIIGLVLGGIQALSRSFYSRIIPHDQTAEFYGFYNMLGKFAVILGPSLIGITGLISGNPRIGIISIAALFIAGGILLYFIDEEKGIQQAKLLSITNKNNGSKQDT